MHMHVSRMYAAPTCLLKYERKIFNYYAESTCSSNPLHLHMNAHRTLSARTCVLHRRGAVAGARVAARHGPGGCRPRHHECAPQLARNRTIVRLLAM